MDLWAAAHLDEGRRPPACAARLSALSSFYRYCAVYDLIGRIPIKGWPGRRWIRTTRPRRGLDWDQARAGPPSMLPPAFWRCALRRRCGLLLPNALPVEEACAADVTDLDE
jgi:hypothetical protein